MKTIGFIGIGKMGLPMVQNLIKNGRKVVVFDTNTEVLKKMRGNPNCATVSNPKNVLDYTNELITMLPENSHVKSVYFGKHGLFESKNLADSLLIDCSTVQPQLALEIYNEFQKKDASTVDAPVSGGVKGAEAGSLTFMVGCDETKAKQIDPILKLMGKTIVYCGKHGHGLVAKLCNNMLLGTLMAGTSEALLLGQRLGLDPKLLTKIINISSGRNWCSELYNPVPGVQDQVPSSNGYSGGFSTKLMKKDLSLAHDASGGNVELPISSKVLEIYKEVLDMGNKAEDKDFSYVFQYLKNKKK
ncbi:putative 3-hydroxyisobutyrate dehydrogenase [Rozella allomycis CSF55]|uniref:3-hydroxyisobutyrate dehydrogenase n=1 Tax=Rozella allomycis (strain CSF55) TaxID=988480 RepID=A0A4P9YQH8_ROZAC|nr:putative 3-hydroxyisobutyrate dehydrogenase [Rozella allomycis CSF55]